MQGVSLSSFVPPPTFAYTPASYHRPSTPINLAAPPPLQIDPPPEPKVVYQQPTVADKQPEQPPAPCPPPDTNCQQLLAEAQQRIAELERQVAIHRKKESRLKSDVKALNLRIQNMTQQHQQDGCISDERLQSALKQMAGVEAQRDEAFQRCSHFDLQMKQYEERFTSMSAYIQQLEGQIGALQAQSQTRRSSMTSSRAVSSTYKVKNFEMAAKLAASDGTDDGLYNGLPIEVEGEGLYRDLVKAGRRPHSQAPPSMQTRPTSSIATSETYKVNTIETAQKLALMDGTDDGMYNGLPIEVAGQGLYRDLVRAGHTSHASVPTISVGSVSSQTTYKVSSMKQAAKVSKLGPADDGTYKGIPIEVIGLGLYSQLRDLPMQ
jgi:hypothetical protein